MFNRQIQHLHIGRTVERFPAAVVLTDGELVRVGGVHHRGILELNLLHGRCAFGDFCGRLWRICTGITADGIAGKVGNAVGFGTFELSNQLRLSREKLYQSLLSTKITSEIVGNKDYCFACFNYSTMSMYLTQYNVILYVQKVLSNFNSILTVSK